MENALVINFTHLLYAAAIFCGVYLAVRYGRMEKLKREAKASDMAAQLAEDKLLNEQMAHSDYKMKAIKAVKLAKMEQELAQLKANGVDGRIGEEREASELILNKIERAFGRNDSAFQTILDQQVNNANKLADSLVRTVKHASKPGIIEQHFGVDKEDTNDED